MTKTNQPPKTLRPWKLVLAGFCLVAAVLLNGCDKDNDNKNSQPSFEKVNLVASTNTFTGARLDPNLVNGWGIAFSPTGNAWVSAEGTGKTVIYDKTGAEKLAAVTVPGSPTGQVFNATTDFVTGGNAAKFLFASTDGTISAWTSGASAVVVIDKSATAAYTGIALASDGGNNFIYAANFKVGKIDVFDKNFAEVVKPFIDLSLPVGYSPFNIQNLGGQLYVMYAKVDETTHEEEKGAGKGYVNIYNPDGSLVKRFTSQGALNAPWGIAQAPNNYMNNSITPILIGNFGDGRINAYDANGNFIGALRSNGSVVEIDGLWGISFAPSTAADVDQNWLFFAAGPSDELQGLFGYLKK